MIKNLPAKGENIREVGSIPRLGRSPGGGNGNPIRYSCLENPMDRGTWRAKSRPEGWGRVVGGCCKESDMMT